MELIANNLIAWMHVIDTAIFLVALKLSYIKTGGRGWKGKAYVVSRYEIANNTAILCTV